MRKSRCPHCGATVHEYRHKLSAPLAYSLYALWQHGGKARAIDLEITHTQINNFHKLKYWTLVDQAGDCEWEITDAGKLWLTGKITLPEYALSYRGETRRLEGRMIGIQDHLDEKYWNTIDYATNRSTPAGTGQAELFN